MRVECVGGCGLSVVVKLPEEIDEEDGYDSDKVEERKQVRMYYPMSPFTAWNSFH